MSTTLECLLCKSMDTDYGAPFVGYDGFPEAEVDENGRIFDMVPDDDDKGGFT